MTQQLAPNPPPRPRAARSLVARGRPWLAAAGAALLGAGLAIEGLARRYIVAESAQFVVFAMVAPALLVLGAPWRLLGRCGPLDRLAAARRRQTSFVRAGAFLLLAAGTFLWLELVPSPPLSPRLPNPHRAAVAALAMWSTWAAAYALGLSSHAVFHGYDPAGGALSAVADQQITVALVWAVSAFCFVPVVFVTLLTWLSASDNPDEELQRLARDERQHPVVRGWGRPARGKPGS